MGGFLLAQQLWSEMRIKVSQEEAEEYLRKFFETYPGVETYIKNTKLMVRKYKFVHTFTGRRRRFPLLLHTADRRVISRSERQAVNARIQTTSNDLLQMNMLGLEQVLEKEFGGQLLLTVHDSIGFQLPKGSTGVKQILDKVIIEDIKEFAPWLPVNWKYDCEKGESYGGCKNAVV